MFAHRFALAMHEPNIDRLKHELTAEQWDRWEQFYAEDPWGEERSDLRMTAMLAIQRSPETDVTPFYPYYDGEQELLARKAAMDERAASLSTEEVEERLRKARELHFASKAKRG